MDGILGEGFAGEEEVAEWVKHIIAEHHNGVSIGRRKMSDWEKLPPYEGRVHQGCLICPIPPRKAKMNKRVAVGFGFAGITKDEEVIYSEPHDASWEELPTLMKFENMARKDPDHDWRLILDGPLHGEEYQRQGRNLWIMVSSNMGFA